MKHVPIAISGNKMIQNIPRPALIPNNQKPDYYKTRM